MPQHTPSHRARRASTGDERAFASAIRQRAAAPPPPPASITGDQRAFASAISQRQPSFAPPPGIGGPGGGLPSARSIPGGGQRGLTFGPGPGFGPVQGAAQPVVQQTGGPAGGLPRAPVAPGGGQFGLQAPPGPGFGPVGQPQAPQETLDQRRRRLLIQQRQQQQVPTGSFVGGGNPPDVVGQPALSPDLANRIANIPIPGTGPAGNVNFSLNPALNSETASAIINALDAGLITESQAQQALAQLGSQGLFTPQEQFVTAQTQAAEFPAFAQGLFDALTFPAAVLGQSIVQPERVNTAVERLINEPAVAIGAASATPPEPSGGELIDLNARALAADPNFNAFQARLNLADERITGEVPPAFGLGSSSIARARDLTSGTLGVQERAVSELQDIGALTPNEIALMAAQAGVTSPGTLASLGASGVVTDPAVLEAGLGQERAQRVAGNLLADLVTAGSLSQEDRQELEFYVNNGQISNQELADILQAGG